MEAILDVVAGITKASKEQLRFFAVFLSCIPLGCKAQALAKFRLGILCMRILCSPIPLASLISRISGMLFDCKVFPSKMGRKISIYLLLRMALLSVIPILLVFLVLNLLSAAFIQYDDYMGTKYGPLSGSQMMLTLKMISFGFDYGDQKKKRQKTKENGNKEVQKPFTMPSLLEFFGYVYFFPTFLTGPPITMSEYLSFTDKTMFNDSYCKGKIPFSWKQAIIKYIVGFIFIPGIMLSNKYPPRSIVTEPYLQMGLLERAMWLWIVIFLYRSKYYLAWNLVEANGCTIGISYNGVDEKGNPKWDRVKNVDIIKLEFAENITMINAAWNMGVTKWLKNYIYLRVTPEGKKPGLYSSLVTYTVSALWHGFYPGYYLCFVFGAVITELSKELRRLIRPKFVGTKWKPLYDLVTIINTVAILTYAIIAFVLLDFGYAITCWSSFYWIGHIVVIGLYALVILYKMIFRPKVQTMKVD